MRGVSLEFLSGEQVEAFGRFTGVPSRSELDRFCVLSDTDVERARQRRRPQNRLGFAVQLVTVRMLGRFLPDPLEVPWEIVEQLAGQVDVDDPSCLKQYAQRVPTQHEHAREITAVYGYRAFEDAQAQQEFREFVAARAWTSTEGPRKLFERATVWLLRHKVLLPGITTLSRRVGEIRDEQAQRLYTAVGALVSPEQAGELEQLVRVGDGARLSELERLRRSPTENTPTELARQVERLGELRGLELSELDVSRIPQNRLWHLARYGLGTKAATIRGLSTARKTATLVAMGRVLTQQATDDTLDVFDVLVRENLIRRAERESAKTRLHSLPRLSRASVTVATGLKTVLGQLRHDSDQAVDADAVWAALETAVGQAQLAEALDAVEELTVDQGDPDAAARAELLERFPTLRKAVVSLVEVPFGAAEGGTATLAEFRRLPQLFPGRCRKLSTAQIQSELVGPSWRRLVLGSPDLAADQVDQRAYISAVTEAFHSRLRRGDVFAHGGLRWADPREKLLDETQWQTAKPEVLTSLELPEDPQPHLAELTGKLDTAYRVVAERGQGSEQQAATVGADGRLHLDKLEPQESPEEATELSRLCAAMLPEVDLPDLILEVHGWTGCLDEYTHLSEAEARMSELPTSVAACLVAEACNVGFTPVIHSGHPALRRDRLSHVQQNYLRPDTHQAANARLLERHNTLDLVGQWGTGAVASVDGLRFVVPSASVRTGANPRYFGQRGKGVTWLNYVNDQVAGLGGLVVTGTIRDSLHVLDGLLDLDGGPHPEMIATDTASYSDQVFGLFALLGYQFSPRLADMPDQKFWRTDPAADYGPLNALAPDRRHVLDLELIQRNWSDLLRVAGSLSTGAMKASELMRLTQGGGSPTTLGKALAEYGRIAKTLHMLAFVDADETYRRRIHTQLNTQESRHALARRIFHGKRGQLYQPYRQGQEDQLGALGLVLNMVVLWNTVYLDAIVKHLRRQGYPVRDEDVARLSPLGWRHINVQGRYAFTNSPPSELRPLRDPTSPDDEF